MTTETMPPFPVAVVEQQDFTAVAAVDDALVGAEPATADAAAKDNDLEAWRNLFCTGTLNGRAWPAARFGELLDAAVRPPGAPLQAIALSVLAAVVKDTTFPSAMMTLGLPSRGAQGAPSMLARLASNDIAWAALEDTLLPRLADWARTRNTPEDGVLLRVTVSRIGISGSTGTQCRGMDCNVHVAWQCAENPLLSPLPWWAAHPVAALIVTGRHAALRALLTGVAKHAPAWLETLTQWCAALQPVLGIAASVSSGVATSVAASVVTVSAAHIALLLDDEVALASVLDVCATTAASDMPAPCVPPLTLWASAPGAAASGVPAAFAPLSVDGQPADLVVSAALLAAPSCLSLLLDRRIAQQQLPLGVVHSVLPLLSSGAAAPRLLHEMCCGLGLQPRVPPRCTGPDIALALLRTTCAPSSRGGEIMSTGLLLLLLKLLHAQHVLHARPCMPQAQLTEIGPDGDAETRATAAGAHLGAAGLASWMVHAVHAACSMDAALGATLQRALLQRAVWDLCVTVNGHTGAETTANVDVLTCPGFTDKGSRSPATNTPALHVVHTELHAAIASALFKPDVTSVSVPRDVLVAAHDFVGGVRLTHAALAQAENAESKTSWDDRTLDAHAFFNWRCARLLLPVVGTSVAASVPAVKARAGTGGRVATKASKVTKTRTATGSGTSRVADASAAGGSPRYEVADGAIAGLDFGTAVSLPETVVGRKRGRPPRRCRHAVTEGYGPADDVENAVLVEPIKRLCNESVISAAPMVHTASQRLGVTTREPPSPRGPASPVPASPAHLFRSWSLPPPTYAMDSPLRLPGADAVHESADAAAERAAEMVASSPPPWSIVQSPWLLAPSPQQSLRHAFK